ncbi:MAG: aldo/keto reductase [Eubacteriales bacterium]|nr:aldo/keto reductase [Eubacteriales bacterium]
MNYRPLGATGLSVSEIGLGCEGMLENGCAMAQTLLDVAEQNGVNYFDLYSSNPELHQALGKALKGRREKFLIQGHVCSAWIDGQYKRTRKMNEVKPAFEALLRGLAADYLDVGMIHYVDSLDDWHEVETGGVLDYVKQLKAEGRVRHIGMSSHNPQAAMAAVRSGAVEVLMFSVNPCYDLQPAGEDCEELWKDENYAEALTNMDPEREALYEACQRMGVGITVMKAFGGGDLLKADQSPAGVALTANQCIHYALTRPAVATVLAGAHSAEQLLDALRYETAADEERDYAAAFAAMPKISWQGHCMYCSHCAPCPKGISVADVTKYLNLCKAQGEIPETVREHYALLAHHASECIRCGACETRCPFGVNIRANMAEAAKLFGK